MSSDLVILDKPSKNAMRRRFSIKRISEISIPAMHLVRQTEAVQSNKPYSNARRRMSLTALDDIRCLHDQRRSRKPAPLLTPPDLVVICGSGSTGSFRSDSSSVKSKEEQEQPITHSVNSARNASSRENISNNRSRLKKIFLVGMMYLCVILGAYAHYSRTELLALKAHNTTSMKQLQNAKALLHLALLTTQHLNEDAKDTREELQILYSDWDTLDKKVHELTQNIISATEKKDRMTHEKSLLERQRIDAARELLNTKRFLHLALFVIQQLKEDTEDTRDELSFLYSEWDTHDKKIHELTQNVNSVSEENELMSREHNSLHQQLLEAKKELLDTKAFLHLALLTVQHFKGEMEDSEDELNILYADWDTHDKQIYELEQTMVSTHEEKERMVRENDLLKQQLHNTASFLQLAVFTTRYQALFYEDVVRQKDFLYDLNSKISRDLNETRLQLL